jgi:hypothetical protein
MNKNDKENTLERAGYDLKRIADTGIYIIFCFLSLGMAWVLRIIITQAIREAQR